MISSLLALVFCALVLSGCTSAKLSPSKLALTEVGKVGEETVYYEELYFLASSYKTEGMTEEQLWETINQNITTNHAIMTLCREVGVEYDEKQLEDDIQVYIDNLRDECGKNSDYRKFLKEKHLTDHYMRFLAKTELLYAKVTETLQLKGDVIKDKAEFIKYVDQNFVRTQHFMIANNSVDNTTHNAIDIQAAYDALTSGDTSIYKLTSGKYRLPHGSQNEDVMMPGEGYIFTKGNMDIVYEATAFKLNVGEFSNVIKTKSQLASGEYADCYYIIERLPLEEDLIEVRYAELYDSYINGLTVKKLEEIKSNLTFEPNDYAKSLNILELKSVGIGTNVRAIIVICSIVLATAALTTAIVLYVLHVRKKSGLNAKKKLKNGKKK
jgi:hypothetical protein